MVESKGVQELVSASVRGDRPAQSALYRSYAQMVLGLVWHFLGPQQAADIEDTVQKVFIALFRSLPLYEGRCSFDTWVNRICSKVCISEIRKKYRKRVLRTNPGDMIDAETVGDSTHNPGADLARKELIGKIREALNKLKPLNRIIVILYEIEGKPVEEIAQILSVPQGTVKSKLFRSRDKLQYFLKGYLDN
jgi:RNA polymerase sigma-70 factor (ECF subfamily)